MRARHINQAARYEGRTLDIIANGTDQPVVLIAKVSSHRRKIADRSTRGRRHVRDARKIGH